MARRACAPGGDHRIGPLSLANGGVWQKKDCDTGVVPQTSIDTEAHWTKSGWHDWCYGWKLHLVATVAAVRNCLAALWIQSVSQAIAQHVQIDVVQAMDFTLPGLCAEISDGRGGQWVDVPHFDW